VGTKGRKKKDPAKYTNEELLEFCNTWCLGLVGEEEDDPYRLALIQQVKVIISFSFLVSMLHIIIFV
jgi:hypothetical protein